MDLDGNEYSQLPTAVLLPIEGELKNEPGGRIERLTHDGFKYANVVVSDSNKIMAFVSNKENGTDMLVYVTELINSQTGATSDSKPFTLPSRLITPPSDKGNSRWVISDISLDDQYLLLTKSFTTARSECYLVHISGGVPERILLPNATEKEEETAYHQPTFSRDPTKPHLIYLVSNAYGDFHSLVAYDRTSGTVLHVTTPEPDLRALRPVNWPCVDLTEGYTNLFVWPLSGPQKDSIIEIKPEWEGGQFGYDVNSDNGKPHELVLRLVSHLSSASLAYLNIKDRLENVKRDESGGAYISVPLARYTQAAPIPPAYRTLPAKLLRNPCMYYHPNDSNSVVPVVISIHGGPEGQSTSNSRSAIHWYIMNELGYAIIYPNVRGSNGYGKHFLALDDVEKREDSVKDIGALLDHIEHSMKNELDASRIAVMGGSCQKYPPINRTSEIKAPLQIAHGDTDSRIPVDQAIRNLMVCEKEGHGFKQKSVIEYTNAAKLHFLERFLPVAKL
ncbi:alpha/beta-hydrolase [Mycena olivaceomarginata]|nr:alpha/beta-hydrolase [Mycena olivaceomarginata]